MDTKDHKEVLIESLNMPIGCDVVSRGGKALDRPGRKEPQIAEGSGDKEEESDGKKGKELGKG